MFYPSCKIKSFIIEYISEKNFCIAKEIHNALYQCNKIRISLQGLYKNLKILIDEDIIVKHGKFYTFSINYLNSMNCFMSNLKSNINVLYDLESVVDQIDRRGNIKMSFCNLLEVTEFECTILKSLLYKYGINGPIYRYRHHYGGFFISKEKDFLDELSKDIFVNEYVYAVTDIDFLACKINASKYQKNKRINITKKCMYHEEMIIGDYICRLQHDTDYFLRLTNFLKTIKDTDIPKHELLQFYKYQYIPNIFTVEKNSGKAKDLIDSFKRL